MADATYTIQLKPAAARDLKRIKDQTVLRRISRAIDSLATNPRPTNAQALQGDGSILQIRVGDYRILYTIEHAALVVLVIRVGRRREAYRRR